MDMNTITQKRLCSHPIPSGFLLYLSHHWAYMAKTSEHQIFVLITLTLALSQREIVSLMPE